MLLPLERGSKPSVTSSYLSKNSGIKHKTRQESARQTVNLHQQETGRSNGMFCAVIKPYLESMTAFRIRAHRRLRVVCWSTRTTADGELSLVACDTQDLASGNDRLRRQQTLGTEARSTTMGRQYQFISRDSGRPATSLVALAVTVSCLPETYR